MARWQFLMRTLLVYGMGADRTCPYCSSVNTKSLGAKWGILQLLRCEDCNLMFRYPKDSFQLSHSFYQDTYAEKGLTTEFPDDLGLTRLSNTAFVGSDRDFSHKIKIIKSIKPVGKVLDFGCSWGYGVWQFRHAGYDAIGFEVSCPRARLGREKLGVQIIDATSDLMALPDGSFDIIFTNHVLEHLPSLQSVFSQFYRLLNPGGLLTIFVPNCSGMESPAIFKRKKIFAFGEKHTLALDHTFLTRNLRREGFETFCLAVPPYPERIDDLADVDLSNFDSSELLVIAHKVFKNEST